MDNSSHTDNNLTANLMDSNLTDSLTDSNPSVTIRDIPNSRDPSSSPHDKHD